MAFRQGYNAEFVASGVALTSYLDSVEFSDETDQLETTTFSKRRKTYINGLGDAKVDISGKYDPATVGPTWVLSNIRGAQNLIAFEYYPGGAAVGQVTRRFNGNLSSYTESAPVGDIVTFGATVQIVGDIYVSVSGATP